MPNQKAAARSRGRATLATTQQKARAARFIFRAEVIDRIGVSHVTLWQWLRAGTFPPCREINGELAWLESDVDEWMESRPIRKYAVR